MCGGSVIKLINACRGLASYAGMRARYASLGGEMLASG